MARNFDEIPEGGVMPAYIGTLLDIDDHEKFGEYARAVAPTLAAYGGRVALRGPIVDVVEGSLDVKEDTRLVMLEFRWMDDARRWYESEEYRPLIQMRERISTTTAFFAKGVELAAPAA
jgi:uncharacterized protein (DUF1330 family)